MCKNNNNNDEVIFQFSDNKKTTWIEKNSITFFFKDFFVCVYFFLVESQLLMKVKMTFNMQLLSSSVSEVGDRTRVKVWISNAEFQSGHSPPPTRPSTQFEKLVHHFLLTFNLTQERTHFPWWVTSLYTPNSIIQSLKKNDINFTLNGFYKNT